MPAIRFIYLRYNDTQNRASPSSCVSNYSQSKGAAGETCRRIGGSAGETCRRIGVSACRHAWRGRVALPRDRRCTSGNFFFADHAAQPFLSYVHSFCVLTLYEHATPVARERNPTAHVCPYDTFLGNAGLFA
jgi:hypothetical protein